MNNINGISLTSIIHHMKLTNCSEEEKKQIENIFNAIDKYDEQGNKIEGNHGDGYLNKDEQKKFKEHVSKHLNRIWNNIKIAFITKEDITDISNKNDILTQDNTRVAKLDVKEAKRFAIKKTDAVEESEEQKLKENIADMIKTAVHKHGVNIETVDINYWTNIIAENSRFGNDSLEQAKVIISIISRETKGKFTKHDVSPGKGTYKGPMQVGPDTLNDISPKCRGALYKLLDENLYNEIMKIAKANNATTPSAMHKLCQKNDSFGVKVGMLCHKFKLAESVSALKKISLKSAIIGMRDGTLKLSENEMKTAMKNSAKRYSSGSNTYAKEVTDSLDEHKFNYIQYYKKKES